MKFLMTSPPKRRKIYEGRCRTLIGCENVFRGETPRNTFYRGRSRLSARHCPRIYTWIHRSNRQSRHFRHEYFGKIRDLFHSDGQLMGFWRDWIQCPSGSKTSRNFHVVTDGTVHHFDGAVIFGSLGADVIMWFLHYRSPPSHSTGQKWKYKL